MGRPITYQDIKDYINSKETGNGCILVSTEEEYENEKINQNKTGTRTNIIIKCTCGNHFKTCLNSFKENNKKHCDECGLAISKKHRDENKVVAKTKVCNRCNVELPLNETYYRPKKLRGKYIYYYVCRQCELEIRFSNESHIKENQIGNKTCKKSKREFPRNINYFYSKPTNKDGLSTICKECNGSNFTKDGFITCSCCNNEYPATEEFFHKQNGGKYSLRSICKKCTTIRCYPYNKKRRMEKPDEIRAWKREYDLTHKKEKSESDKKYRNTPNGKIVRGLNEWKRRSKKKNLLSNLTKEEWINCLEVFTEKDGLIHCAYCGEILMNPTQDHFIPISKGGNYTKDNIIPCCSSCNSSKNNKNFNEWYKREDFYSIDRELKILNYINQFKEAK